MYSYVKYEVASCWFLVTQYKQATSNLKHILTMTTI